MNGIIGMKLWMDIPSQKNSKNVWKYAIDVDGAQFTLSNRDAHLTSISSNVEKLLRPIPNIIPLIKSNSYFINYYFINSCARSRKK